MNAAPAWLTAKVDQRLALILDAMKVAGLPKDVHVIMAPLSEPGKDDDYDTWDLQCDNCGKVCKDGELHCGQVKIEGTLPVPIVIVYGACSQCCKVQS